MRLAVVVSHVIQYFCPQYVSWSAESDIDLRVFFGTPKGLEEYYDAQFGRNVKWEGIKLDFPHEFLAETEARVDLRGLDEKLDHFEPDAILVYGWDQPLIRRAVKWAGRNGKSLMMLSDAEFRSGGNWLKAQAKAILLPPILKKFDIFLTVGDSNEEFYRKYGVTDRHFVRCSFPIDHKLFDARISNAAEVRADFRSRMGIPIDHKVILNVGKLVPWKRQVDLVDFSNGVQGKRDDVTILLAGTGQDDTELRARCRLIGPGGVMFAGFIQPNDLPEFYIASDLYAVTSSRDRHSLAVSEAIYSGLPVVISDRCGSIGPSDDVRPGVNGLVFPCGDVNALHRLIHYVLDTAGAQQALGRASRSIGIERQADAHRTAMGYAKTLLESNAYRPEID